MNRYPLWKNLLLLVVIATAVIYAMPNLYGDDPAVQISAGRQASLDNALVSNVETQLKEADLPYKGLTLEDNRLLIRFADADSQLKAREMIAGSLAEQDYIVALNLAPTTPEWLTGLKAEPMNLGLDLRGGVHFLMEVDMQAVQHQALTGIADDLRLLLRESVIRYTRVEVEGDTLFLGFRDATERDKAEQEISRDYPDVVVSTDESADRPTLALNMTETFLRETQTLALQQNITTLRNRINELGVAEPTVQQQGQNRIVVQLPGVQDTAQAKKILGATATLEFRLVDFESDVQSAVNGRVPANSELFNHRDGTPYLLNKRVMLTGENIINAASTLDAQTNSPAVSVTIDGKGARIFSNVTGDNIGNPMAVVFIESKSETEVVAGEEVRVRKQFPEIISVATIRDQLGKKFQITGLDSTTEARDLALLLRAGALAAPIEIVEERTVGPSMGQENIDKGFKSVVIGLVLVLVFMAVWYRVFGLVANLALAVNLVLLVALLSMLQATLTMPGIAGIVLTVGMAVDANVLIFERIREELHIGNSPQASIRAGYDKALSTIADANVTTLIAAVVLFGFGTGTIKGFAVTLSLGILTSMFTAIMGTRALVNLIYGRQHRPALSI
ncbi:Protein-export membrane protein SecD [Methylophaga frappieri]|uniref:Protein translocase subunit SecD n=1 Tax=Methylophaga frappieri (strain ATCC BAA-2434 / DSM 25690 / JAM7) TaxID=754477 RepID=I1YKQ4_METFJ|nr:protein translocase subunit SecD [Methylophaga frappieri]AFJ03497.1 Protein-export membrane protein SecD [Methylophaga frappieri]